MEQQNISRRDFMKGIAAGAVTLGTMGVLNACQATSTPPATTAAPEATTVAATEKALEAANEVAKAVSGSFTPGTYTAKSTGMGEIVMTAVFDETSITDIKLDLSKETADIGQAAGEDLISRALASQSPNFDGVSGATITSNAVKKCLEDVIDQASGKALNQEAAVASEADDWLGKEPDITDSDVKETIDTEVLVIGLGVAGVAAARAAAEEGAQVFAAEKADSPQCRSGEYAVINGKTQAKWGRDTWTDEQIEKITNYHMLESSYKVKRPIFSKWAHNCGEIFDWWVEPNKDLFYAETTRADIPDESANNFIIPIFLPLPDKYDWTKEEFPCYPTSIEFKPNQSVNLQCNWDAAMETGNIEARFGHFAEKLIMEDGRCAGAYIRNAEDGSYIRVNASKGVILATGDYSQNDAMVKHFCPDVIDNGIQRLFTSIDVEGNFTNMGDGIKMGVWAGAKVQNDHAPTIHHMGGGADIEGVGVMGIAGFLNLDMNGKRFMNEDLPGQQIENQIEMQKDRKTWQIFDSSWPEQLPYFPAEHGGACYYEDFASEEEGPRNNKTYRNYKSPYQLEKAVEDGRAIKADTLQELVEKMYPDSEDAQKTALASIERYNELAAKGVDEDFGKVSSRLFSLDKAPFYADQFTTALLLFIGGGLESDEDCHTLDTDRNIIPGLYVAGNIQGNRFAHEYPITLKGVSHSMAMYYGYVAGKNAVKGI